MEKIFGIKKYADELNVAELMAVKGGANTDVHCNEKNSGIVCHGGAAVHEEPAEPEPSHEILD